MYDPMLLICYYFMIINSITMRAASSAVEPSVQLRPAPSSSVQARQAQKGPFNTVNY